MKTKHLIFTLLVVVFGFTGCFGEKKEITQEEKNSIIAEAKSAYAGNRGALISGAKSGIYLKDNDGNVRLYGFEDFFNMSAEQESAFVANWGNCVADSSYIVFSDNMAATIKLVRDNNGSFTTAKTASTISVNDTGYTKDSIVLDGLSGLKKYANGDGPRVTFSSKSENVLLNTSLTLTTMDGAVIRYSENDSSVTTNSTQYTTAISINGAKVVRARAYMTGWIEGTEYRKSYGITAKYKVIYNGNESTAGSVSDSNSYSVGDSVTIAEKGTIDREYWHFKGWNTKADGSGASYPVGATLNIGNGDITLYAQWKAGIKDVEGFLGMTEEKKILFSDGIVYNFNSEGLWKKDMIEIEDIAYIPKIGLDGIKNWFVVKKDGGLYGIGSDYSGLIMTGVKKIEAGEGHILVLKEDDSLWSFGKNIYGQLGDGTTTDRNIPQQIMTDVKDFKAIYRMSAVLKKDGSLWSFGLNDYGQLGDGTKINRSMPQQVISGVMSICVSGVDLNVIKEDGSLWCTGMLNGTDVFTQKLISVKYVTASMYSLMVVKSDGSLWARGVNVNWHFGIGDIGVTGGLGFDDIIEVDNIMTGVKSVNNKFINTTLIVKEDGSLLACGYNCFGEAGPISMNNQENIIYTPKQILTGVKKVWREGLYYTRAIMEKEDGTIWYSSDRKPIAQIYFIEDDNSIRRKVK